MNKNIEEMAELKCVNCGGKGRYTTDFGDTLCIGCDGTGRRFRELSRECPNPPVGGLDSTFMKTSDYWAHEYCRACRGTKRVLADVHLEDLLDVMEKARYGYVGTAFSWSFFPSGHIADDDYPVIEGQGNKLSIAAKAAVKALEKEQDGAIR